MKILMIGHSHLKTFTRAAATAARDGTDAMDFRVIELRSPKFRAMESADARNRPLGPKNLSGIDRVALRAEIEAQLPCDGTLLSINGNEHNVLGLLRGPATDIAQRLNWLERSVRLNVGEWLEFLLPLLPAPVLAPLPPPPVESESHIRSVLKRLASDAKIEEAAPRLRFWRLQCELIRELARDHGIEVLENDADVVSPGGFLAENCIGKDSSHGNRLYGDLQLAAARRWFMQRIGGGGKTAGNAVARAVNPYTRLPDSAFWNRSVARDGAQLLDPVIDTRFRIGTADRVATAGSCFAQHISRRLRNSGFRFMQYEPGTGDSAEEELHYEFSARYGNIYSSRQLLQLFQRAFGYFRPLERVWLRDDGRYCDPFRPRLRPAGFETAEQVLAATEKHLECVKRMFLELDVFVFTLGLSECWYSLLDGAVFPLAPGVAGGQFDATRHGFLNLRVADVVQDLDTLLAGLERVNPGARMILTVSPVPLAATASGAHVVTANARSKAVLRAAADEIAAKHPHVCYFPSYEIIAGVPGGPDYMDSDRRNVTQAGVDRVMQVFLERMTEAPRNDAAACSSAEELLEAECDEEALEATLPENDPVASIPG